MPPVLRHAIAVLLLPVLFFATATTCKNSAYAFDRQLSQAPLEPVALPQSIKPETIGFILFDPASGTVVEEHHRRLPLIPASTTKVLTLGMALHDLGPDYRFETTLGWTGKKNSGDLFLLGGEDPELRVRDLLAMLQEMREKSPGAWTGRFFYSGEPLFKRSQIDISMEDEAAYNPALSSLSLESNIIYLRWKKTWRLSEAHLVPSLPGIDLQLVEKTPDEDDEREIVYAGQGEGWMLRKTRHQEGVRPIPVKDAGLFTARVFQKLALTRGVAISDPQAAGGTAPDSVISVHRSRPLFQIAEHIMATSDNAMTELILLHMAKKQSGVALPLREAAAYLEARYQSLMPALDWEGFQLRNGSGLTPENRITAEQLLAGLLYVDSIPGGIERYLPIGGWSQGMMGRLNRPDETFRVAAKAGGIYYSVTLTGFLYSKSGKRLAFAILVSDLEKRQQYETASDRRSRRRSNEARTWMIQNREVLDSIVSRWLQKY